MSYLDIQKEETLKARVYRDYFDTAAYVYEPNIDNIDFVISDVETVSGALFPQHFLWAEAKKNISDPALMLTQLILTCKKTVDRGLHLPPPFLGCFDGKKIAFVPFYDVLPIFVEADVDWNAVPNQHDAPAFKNLRSKVQTLIAKNIEVFEFDVDSDEIKKFIKQNLKTGAQNVKIHITKNNFVHIYYKWAKEVKPKIDISENEWQAFNKSGLFDSDFFRADMMAEKKASGYSTKFSTIIEKLKVVLENDKYNLNEEIGERLYKTEIGFKDEGEAYRKFWEKYERPPAEEYHEHIIERRDLLVPVNFRERTGEFFTPPEWVAKSQEYIEMCLGENWQKEYYVWDCCAGSGNLLAGLQEKDRIWASDISAANVNTMQAIAERTHNLLQSHIFQFDFLNDKFNKLPDELRKIIENPNRKMLVYINPPYAETMTHGEHKRIGLNKTWVNMYYYPSMGNCANRELFVQFLTRLYKEIPNLALAEFSTLKTLQAPNFKIFRENFRAKLLKMFIVPANSFDNVKGQFPIGFKIWDTKIKEAFKSITADVYNKENEFIGTKTIQSYSEDKLINEWIITTRNRENEKNIGFMACLGNDFQSINLNYIMNEKSQMPAPRGSWVTDKNLIEVVVYFAVRHIIPATWLNDRDQFLWPNAGWTNDKEFQNNCFAWTLFHGQNTIQAAQGLNHWLPFTETEIGAKGEFQSHFMSDYIKTRTFSPAAAAVLDAGRDIFRYYHEKIRGKHSFTIDASFYDIRLMFQGQNDAGRMNSSSTDKKYTALLAKLRAAQKNLARQIAPKIYEYGFLKG